MKVIKLESEIRPLLPYVEEVNIAVATMSGYGLELLMDNLSEECQVNLLVGIDLLTPLEIFKELLEHATENWDVRVFRRKAFFHPKLYILNNNDTTAYVGSGNFTKGGIQTHVELFTKLEGEDTKHFQDWFNQYFALGEPLSQDFIEEYEPLFNDAVEAQYKAKKKIRKLKRNLDPSNAPVFDLESCNFNGQFFYYEHFNAFTGSKPYSMVNSVIEERKSVKNRLFDLYDRLEPIIQSKGWDLHAHEMKDHIISSYQHGIYTSDDLGALWLHYGRSPADLKKFKKEYGENQTSMYQMRIQVLVHAHDISVWLRVGKNNGSIVDRTAFKQSMRITSYKNRFFELVSALPDEYFISINNEDKKVRSFNNPEELHDFVKEDSIYTEYFIIGRDYRPDDISISDKKIATTIISDFEMLYPIYLHIKTTI